MVNIYWDFVCWLEKVTGILVFPTKFCGIKRIRGTREVFKIPSTENKQMPGKQQIYENKMCLKNPHAPLK